MSRAQSSAMDLGGRMAHPTGSRHLAVRHETRYAYDSDIEVAQHSAWLRPRDCVWQRVSAWQLQIDPEPEAPVQYTADAFGNWRLAFSHALVHDHLDVISSFEVEVDAAEPLNFAGSPTWELAAQALRYSAGVQQPDAVEFMLGSQFAPQATPLMQLAADLFWPGRTLLEATCALMQRIHGRLIYEPDSTTVGTDALQALELGRGVCQDYAHLMIGSLRSMGLAARYVSGYLLTQPPPGQPRLLGADASHAWVALWCPVQGWIALDPTNNIAVSADHVTLAWGRDYADVAPLRGMIRGGGSAPPEVAVTVVPVAEMPNWAGRQSQSQSQSQS